MTITELNSKYADLDLKSSLELLRADFKSKIVFSTSLGQEDQVITDVIFKNKIDIEIFTLDTGRLFQETYELLDRTNAKYSQKIKAYFPDNQAVEALVSTKGFNSFYNSVENRKECCKIRKIVPLRRALQNAEVWITGLRAEQSENRAEMNLFEWDENFKTIKFNPLINWSLDEVLDHLKTNKVPDNPLHRKGFISIGCMPCTRAIAEGEHPRAGRWWWENSQKECGLHG
jgi:phosphoadenosine phosphosulfate reductase